MNTTVLENRLAEFTTVMKGIADNLQYFRELVEKEMAEKEARKDAEKDEGREREMYKKRELARNLIIHKGDGFTVCDEFTVPATEEDVDPDNRPTANIVKQGERLTVEKVDCLSSKYEVEVTVFRNDNISRFVLTLDQIRKMVENDILVIIGKAN